MSVFVLSIESTPGQSEQYGFHLGTDDRLARQIVEEKFRWRVHNNVPVVTMALKRNGKIFDVYYGDGWQSDVGFGDKIEDDATNIERLAYGRPY